MTCVIICGGRIDDVTAMREEITARALNWSFPLTAAARHCMAMGVVPDIVLGDF